MDTNPLSGQGESTNRGSSGFMQDVRNAARRTNGDGLHYASDSFELAEPRGVAFCDQTE